MHFYYYMKQTITIQYYFQEVSAVDMRYLDARYVLDITDLSNIAS